MVRQSLVLAGRRSSQTSESVEPASSASHAEVPLRSKNPPPSRVKTIQRLVSKARLSRVVAEVAAADLQSSTPTLPVEVVLIPQLVS